MLPDLKAKKPEQDALAIILNTLHFAYFI